MQWHKRVCIYAADHLRVSEVSLGASPSVEHVLVRLSLSGSDCLLLGCIYCSPSSTGEEHAAHLKHLIQQANSLSYSHVVLVGDFNLPQIDWETESSSAPVTHISHAFLDVVHECLLQHVHHPTRYRLGEASNVLALVLYNGEEPTTSSSWKF